VTFSRDIRAEKEAQKQEEVQLQNQIHSFQNDLDTLGRQNSELKDKLNQTQKELEETKAKLDTVKFSKASTSTIKAGTSGQLPDDNVCVIAMKKYFPQETWRVANAIIHGESGGITTRVSATNDYGCFQIHNCALYDPDENARVAYYKFSKYGWQPWTVYTKGTYLRYL
jgi:TolA-binding protein